MGRRACAALLFVAALVPPCRLRAAPATPSTELIVGRPVALQPPALPVSVICDDTSIVRVEDAGDRLVVTGLRPGSTACSFGTPSRAGRRHLYRFDVRAAPQ